MRSLTLTALEGIPEIHAGDDLAALVLTALGRAGIALAAGGALGIAPTNVSKSEGGTAGRAGGARAARAGGRGAATR